MSHKMSENLESLRAMRDNMRAGGHYASSRVVDDAISEIERLTRWVDEVAKVANEVFDLDGCCHWETVCDAIEETRAS